MKTKKKNKKKIEEINYQVVLKDKLVFVAEETNNSDPIWGCGKTFEEAVEDLRKTLIIANHEEEQPKILKKFDNLQTEVSGGGYWSDTHKKVKIDEIGISYYNGDDYINIDANFSNSQWNVDKYGLIYTDKGFLKTFRAALIKRGMPKKVADDIDYTEQGMQGDNYVSLGAGEIFCDWLKSKL